MMFESVSRLMALDPLIPWEIGKYLIILFVVYLMYTQKIRASLLVALSVFLILAMLIKGVTWKGFFFNATIFLGLLLTQNSFKCVKYTVLELLRCCQTLLLPFFVFLGASINQISDFQNRQYELGSSSILDKIPSNQVSTYMGAAFFLSIVPFFFINEYKKKLISYVAPGAFLLVGLLSFSRGGMITAIIGLLVIFLGYIFSGKLNYLFYILLFVMMSIPIALLINDESGGKLLLRYQGETEGTLHGSKEKTLDSYSTGRFSIFMGDWETFKSNWLFGVEIGESRLYRVDTEKQQSHVELSRVLAEHGLPGGIAFFILILNGLNMFKRSYGPKQTKYLMCAIWIIGFATSFHGATRTILPFVFMSLPLMILKSAKGSTDTLNLEN